MALITVISTGDFQIRWNILQKSNNLIGYVTQCSFTSWNSLKCYLRTNLICEAHQDMKLNAGQ